MTRRLRMNLTVDRLLVSNTSTQTKTALRDMNTKEQLAEWRETWTKGCAKALRRAGHEQEADRWEQGHLTLLLQREAALAQGDMAWAEELDRVERNSILRYRSLRSLTMTRSND
jgi:hypothetical protein